MCRFTLAGAIPQASSMWPRQNIITSCADGADCRKNRVKASSIDSVGEMFSARENHCAKSARSCWWLRIVCSDFDSCHALRIVAAVC